ncbi:CIC11C00000003672 [Sungouiella intermedia]|uniref:4-nitrophenylphosphatase n=1 Tax=Sungouiella intermedia TaxID=45354 RepID=A0A1L0CV42_9ASCO|nr:CIC11C00000003672 [[Candida] intermedia]
MTIQKTMHKVTTKEQAIELLDSYDSFLFDCDGVIWLDNDLIPGVLELIDHLKTTKKKYAFVTNNSSRSRENYLSKFAKLGFSDVSKNMIFPTCYSAALVLRERFQIPEGSKVWVLGDGGIEEELRECGYIPVGGTDSRLDDEWDPDHELLDVDPEVKAVVVGSTKKLNYLRIATTVQYLLHDHKALPFIGTNIDRTYPGPKGRILPAGGSVVLFMKYTCDRDFVDVGKPSRVLLDAILELTNFERDLTLMVGDTLYTDIKFGNDGELGGDAGGTLLVLSGGTKARDLESLDDSDVSLQPSYYIESLGHLVELMRL